MKIKKKIIDRVQATQLFNIRKSYEGYPSKTNADYETRLTWENAVSSIDGMERLWRRNGGIIVSREESILVVEESDGSNVITFEIIES